MKQSKMKWTILAALALLLLVGGCKKKEPPVVAPTPPPPPVPTASLSANPNSVQKGQSAQLTWRTENATDVSIEGIGAVQPAGSQSVTPEQSTTYRLIAKGAGGTQEATARVTVTEPPKPAEPPKPTATEAELFAQNVRDVFFDYDSYDIRPDAQQSLATAARFLAQHPNLRFTVEGHCDERGSTEYNLALGDNRANAVKQALVAQGVSADRIRTISYGKEKPFCTESNEQCWQQNRRGHYVLQR